MNTNKRVLLINYAFPPVGGAGVQRVAKFAKYLGEFGWQPSVLTVANPSVPAMDPTLLAEVPPDVIVRRAKTLEPSYAMKQTVAAGSGGSRGVRGRIRGLIRRTANLVLQPDPQILWLPRALREGQRLLREVPHDAIVASGPPFSTFLLGAALSRRSGVPLVLDYRDEWEISNNYLENKQLGWLSRRVQGVMQRRVIRAASALVATTQASARRLDAVRSRAGGRSRVECIYNGFDPADFPAPSEPTQSGDRYRITYVGTLWNLTSVEPLVRAVEALNTRQPALASRLELVFAGRRMEQQQQILNRLRGTRCGVVEHPYVEHRAAIQLLQSSDALTVLLSDLPGAERVVPAKIFEYFATRRPVIAIAPGGELREILREYPAARQFEPADVARLSTHLEETVRAHPNGAAPVSQCDVSRFDRRKQSQQLAGILDSLR